MAKVKSKKKVETNVYKDKPQPEKPEPKFGRGEIFVCKVRDGKTQHHHVVVRHPEEIITVHGARAVKPTVIAEFIGSKFICKPLADMSADQVSKALHKKPEYGMEFWSLSDPVATKKNPHTIATDECVCLYCGKSDFSYKEEYQTHVPICRKVHGEKYIKKEIERIEKKVESEPYVPNKPIGESLA